MSEHNQEDGRSRTDVEAVLGVDGSASASLFGRWLKPLGFALVILLAAAAIGAWALSGTRTALSYVTEPVLRAGLTVVVTATGSVQPTNKVEVSSELSGTVRKVLVDYNSRVKVGSKLAELDTDKLRAAVDSSRAKLVATKARVIDAQATVAEKKLDFERKRTLAERGIGSQLDLEVAQAAYERALAALGSARADVEAAAADLKLQETNLAKSCICSPIDGVVLERNVDPGQTVASSLQAPVLFSIAEDLTQMEVQVDVDEADVGKVEEGQHATFTVDAYPEKQFAASIRQLRFGSEIVQGVVTYKAVLATENPDLLLRPGMTATAEITVQEVENALSVPNAALRFSPPSGDAAGDNRNFLQKLTSFRPRLRRASRPAGAGRERRVWILADGEPQPVVVEIGASDGQRTQITAGGLAEGQQVIVDASIAGK